MALNKVSKKTVRDMAKNLAVAGKILRLMVERMPENQPELICELATRVEWARGFRKWAGRLKEDQPLQLQLLLDGKSVDQQIAERQGAKKRKKPPKEGDGKKSKSRQS